MDVECSTHMRNAHKIFVGNSESRVLGIPRCVCEVREV
jgi:hypothetical protein